MAWRANNPITNPTSSLELLGVESKPRNPTPTPLESHLIELSLAILDLLNTRDFNFTPSHPWIQHVSPDVDSHFEVSSFIPATRTREATMASLVAWVANMPDVNTRVENVSVQARDAAGRATVWVATSLGGLNAGERRETINMLSWERDENGKWWVVKYRGLRSMDWGFDAGGG